MTDYNPYAREVEKVEYKVLEVHAYDWVSEDKATDEDCVAIRCWALDRNSEPYLLRFNNFPAYCYVELPTVIKGGYTQTWNDNSVKQFVESLNFRLGIEHEVHTYNFVRKEKVYYYRNKRAFPMVRLVFKNIESMNKCRNILSKPIKTLNWGIIKCNVWETNISIIRKLLSTVGLRYSQWFRVLGYKVESELQISNCKNEYIAEWKTIAPVSTDECKDWSTKPGILSFDIECYSDNHRAMPNKYDAKHLVYMISCIYQKYKQPETRRRYGIVIGDCNEIPEERLQNCKIIRTNNELELAQAFADVVNETDPEILVGYNIIGFDYPYMDHRILRTLNNWPKMSRIYGQIPHMESINWQSGAYGHQSINIVHMEGRISIDMLPVIKREFTNLDKYDLNTVCDKFIGKTKHDVKAKDMFEIFEAMRDSMEKLKRINYMLVNNPELSNSEEYMEQKNQAIKEYEKAKADTTKVMEYCIQDSELVIELMEKTNTWIGLIEMSNIVGTTIVDLFTRGQQVRCLSQLYDMAAKEGFVLDSRSAPAYTFSGGYVKEPIPGLYDNIICLDFSSLYPSIIMAYNICYTTLVHPDMEHLVPDEDCNVIEFDQEEIEDEESNDDYVEFDFDHDNKGEDPLEAVGVKKKRKKKVVNTVTRHYRFKFYKKQEGLLPKLERTLVAERRAVRSTGEQAGNECKILEKIEKLSIALKNYIENNVSNELFNYNDAKSNYDEVKSAEAGKVQDIKVEYAEIWLKICEHIKNGDRQILVSISKQLISESKERLDKIEVLKLMSVVLDKRQLAIKVSCNSFFGFLGVRNGGKMPLLEGAMSITAMGRKLINEVRVYIENNYNGVQVYGDTDSVMMDLNIKDPKLCNYWGNRLAEEISGISPGKMDVDGKLWPEGRPGLFPPPLAMEFEKAMRLLCIRKKKYAAYLINKKGEFDMEDVKDKNGKVIGRKRKMLKKGIVLARRDNCKFLRETYETILEIIMDHGTLDNAIGYLVSRVKELIHGKISYENLIIIKGLGANYKSQSYFMAVFWAYLKREEKDVRPGDRLDFLIIKKPDETLLGNKMRLKEQYLEKIEMGIPEEIDNMYYLEKILMNPINQLFSVGFTSTIDKIKDKVSYKAKKKKKHIYLDEPVKMITALINDGYDIDNLPIAVNYTLHNIIPNNWKPIHVKFNIIRETSLLPSAS